MMELDWAGEDALLLRVDDEQELLGHRSEPSAQRPSASVKAPRRRVWARMRRMDVACLAIVGFVACYIGLNPPALREENPLWHVPVVASSTNAQDERAVGYMTYDDIDVERRRDGYRVAYTERGFEVDGKATLLLGGSIHYPRSTPGMWRDLLLKAKHDGLNHIELYIFWNLHEQERGVFNFAGNANITQFYEMAAEAGLFLHVRFGPYVCAEWSNGGLPLWLNEIPGMHVRTSNTPWQTEMERFVRYMVELSRPFLAENGGPIILAQIENEYGMEDDAYVQWCGNLVERLNTSIPWIMCNGKAANDTILACNGNDCVDFASKQLHDRASEPFVWTEDEGWYQKWAVNEDASKDNDHRSPQDMSYAVARWFAVGGAAHNYYMYHGGNNYGRAASAGVTTMYADGVNLHADGLSNEPKRSHLSKLHHTLIECNDVLMSNERQLLHPHDLLVLGEDASTALGSSEQRAYIYGLQENPNRVVFLENDANKSVTVAFGGVSYLLRARSIVILKGDVLLFDTSEVEQSFPIRQHRTYTSVVAASALQWEAWSEFDAPSLSPRKRVVAKEPAEQLQLTADQTDYLIYDTLFESEELVSGVIEDSSKASTLTFTSCEANGFLVFVDGEFVGEKHLAYPGDNCSKEFEFELPRGVESGGQHNLQLVSVSLGVHSLGQAHRKGLTGKVRINQDVDLVGGHQWTMSPGLLGEALEIYRPQWRDSVPWIVVPPSVMDSTNAQRFMVWYQTSFRYIMPVESIEAASGHEEQTSLLLDCAGLTRGRAYINGHDLGRYWLIENDQGKAVQRYYHVPLDWLLHDQENVLVIFDELGGSVANVRLVSSRMALDPVDAWSTAPNSPSTSFGSYLPSTEDVTNAVLTVGRS